MSTKVPCYCSKVSHVFLSTHEVHYCRERAEKGQRSKLEISNLKAHFYLGRSDTQGIQANVRKTQALLGGIQGLVRFLKATSWRTEQRICSVNHMRKDVL